jgi:hypothetical protein
MTMEIHELVIRVTVVEPDTVAPDWAALERRLKAELRDVYQEEIQAQLQRMAER